MKTLPKVGDRVLAYRSSKDVFEPATVLRVYDENEYRKEHYPDGNIPEWDDVSFNDPIVNVIFDSGRHSSAHFVWGLREINS